MPQPAAVTTAPDDLIGLFKQSQVRIEAEYAAILTDPNAARRRRRLVALRNMVNAELAALEAAAGVFVADTLPVIYQAGGQTTGVFSFTQFHRTALESIQADTMNDILAATDGVRDDTKRWIRETTRRLIAEGEIEGQTATQLARKFAKLAPKAVDAAGLPLPITAVTYSDGSVRTIETYADMLFRTRTATTYNDGTINTGVEAGIDRYEIFDGPGCGLTSHDDGTVANGMIVDAATAAAHPVSHPNCRRSFGARPDLDDEPLPEPIPREGPARQAPLPTAARAGRSPRTPRTPRNTRTVSA